MAMVIGEALSRIRNQVKAVRQDAGMTDRFFYSMIMKHAKLLMRRQDNQNRIMKFNGIWKPLDFVPLIDIDSANAECHCIHSNCSIKRTKDRLPNLIEGYWGSLIRSVSSLDYSQEFTPTFPTSYNKIASQKTQRYNKTKYYWLLDGYAYFPNTEFDAVRMEVVPEGKIGKYNCDPEDDCLLMIYQPINIPEFLFSEVEQMVMRDLGITMQIPQDPQSDNKNPIAQ